MENISNLVKEACCKCGKERLTLLERIKSNLLESTLRYNVEWRQLKKKFRKIDLSEINVDEYNNLMYYIIYVKDELKFRDELYKHICETIYLCRKN